MNNMARYSRKFRAHGAHSIGFQIHMMSFLTYICIPVNIGIIFFTGHKLDTPSGKSVMGFSTEASLRKFLFVTDWEFWTPLTVLQLAVILEHSLFFLKQGISLTVPDVPSEVAEAENKRPKMIR
jgi:hypothetical protein